MARGSSSAGCLPILAVLLGIGWLGNKCSGGDERRAAETAEIERQRVQRENESRWAADAKRVAELDAKRREQEAQAALVAAESARIRALKPHQRVATLKECVTTGRCPANTFDPNVIFDSAASPAERKQLEATATTLYAAKERKQSAAAQAQARADRVREQAEARADRAAARASAPLLCCDGTTSPSCTCGRGSRRGCCSRHGGVCGCSAD